MPRLARKRTGSDDILILALLTLVLIGAVSWYAGRSAGPPLPVLTKRPASHFTLGSTKAEVERIQGQPTTRDHAVWQYGPSQVFFREERATGWHIAAGWGLKVKLIPRSVATRSYFRVGSMKDEVAAVQGTPGGLRDDEWQYGASRVYFRGDKVIAWSNPSAYPLRVEGSSGTIPVVKAPAGLASKHD